MGAVASMRRVHWEEAGGLSMKESLMHEVPDKQSWRNLLLDVHYFTTAQVITRFTISDDAICMMMMCLRSLKLAFQNAIDEAPMLS